MNWLSFSKIVLPIIIVTSLVAAVAIFYKNNNYSIHQTQRFPRVSGENLKGKRFEFPNDFTSGRTLVLFAYEQEQADILSSWVNGVDLLNRQIEWYETPVIATPLQLGSFFIDGGMRKGIPDERIQERVVTLYTDRNKFSESLGILFDIHGAYAMVVERDGKVIGYVQGAYSTDGAKKIKSWIEAAE